MLEVYKMSVSIFYLLYISQWFILHFTNKAISPLVCKVLFTHQCHSLLTFATFLGPWCNISNTNSLRLSYPLKINLEFIIEAFSKYGP